MFKSNDKTERMTIRLTKEQADFIAEVCEAYNFKASDYVRMLINQQKFIYEKKKENDNANK